VISEVKGLVPVPQSNVLVAGHQGTVALPGDSGVALHLVESASSPAECPLSAVAGHNQFSSMSRWIASVMVLPAKKNVRIFSAPIIHKTYLRSGCRVAVR
jgi:hypothetical protein